MIRHIVILEMDEIASLEDIEEAFEQANRLIGAIPGVTNHMFGPSANEDTDKRLFAMTMDMDDLKTLAMYQAHENHLQALSLINPYKKELVSIQINI